MKSREANKTKVLLLGIVVALISLLSSAGATDFAGIEGLLSQANTENPKYSDGVDASVQLEKMAVSKKLAKELDQKIDLEGNTMLN